VDRDALRQDGWPALPNDAEKAHRALPMVGKVVFDQILEPLEGHAFDGELIEQGAQLARQLQRLRCRLRDTLTLIIAERQNEAGQHRVALGRLDGWRKVERAV